MYTDKLIEGYIVESYIPVIVDDADRLQAEKEFKTELINGPNQRITYGNTSYLKPVGTFDLDNFHKAYDKDLQDKDLLGLFNNDGTLKDSATYGKFKNLDKKEPVIKYLGALWGVQFKKEMEFTSVKKQREAEMEKERLEGERQRQERAAAEEKERLEREKEFIEAEALVTTKAANIETFIRELPEIKKILAESRNIELKIEFNYNQNPKHKRYKSDIDSIRLRFNNAGYPDGRPDLEPEIYIFDIEEMSEIDILKIITKKFKEKLPTMATTIMASNFLLDNYTEYEKTLAGQELYKRKVDWLVFKNGNKFYEAKIVRLCQVGNYGTINYGLMLKDKANPSNVATKFDPTSFKLVAANCDSYHDTGRCWDSSKTNIYINLNQVTKQELETVLNLSLDDYDNSWRGAQEDYAKLVEVDTVPFSKLFTHVYIKKYTCDSGD